MQTNNENFDITLSKYIKYLQGIEEDYGDLKLMYAHDDEGNSFQMINNIGPCVVLINHSDLKKHYIESFKEFETEDRNIDESMEKIPDDMELVCLIN